MTNLAGGLGWDELMLMEVVGSWGTWLRLLLGVGRDGGLG